MSHVGQIFIKYVFQISEESLGCVSDQKCLKRFENWEETFKTLLKMSHYILFIAKKYT